MPRIVVYIAAAMLLVGAAPLPYAYYPILRLVATAVFAVAAYISYQRKYSILPWIFGFCALLFNPIAPVHLPKELWAAIDIAGAILLITKVGSISQDGKDKGNSRQT